MHVKGLLASWPFYLSSTHLSFSICKMEIIIASTWDDYVKTQCHPVYKVLRNSIWPIVSTQYTLKNWCLWKPFLHVFIFDHFGYLLLYNCIIVFHFSHIGWAHMCDCHLGSSYVCGNPETSEYLPELDVWEGTHQGWELKLAIVWELSWDSQLKCLHLASPGGLSFSQCGGWVIRGISQD